MRRGDKTLALVSFLVALLLLFIGTQTMSKQKPTKVYQESTTILTNEVALPVESTTTTNTTLEEVTTTTEATVVNTTVTTRVVVRTTTTKPYIDTTIPQTRSSGSDGPPRNITSLVGCIAYYESTWGEDPNVFQFTQGTWEAYGGTGSPSNASYSTQEAIFWAAWEDAGHHHWLAQKGRCF